MRSPKQFLEEFVANLIMGRRQQTRPRSPPEPYMYKPPPNLSFQSAATRVTLTRPSSPTSSAIEESDAPSRRASLNTLPTEIRQLIWEHVLGSHFVHLAYERDHPEYQASNHFHPEKRKLHLVGYVCKLPDPTNSRYYHGFCIPAQRQTTPWPAKVSGILCLLLVCKRIYRESINILYTANTFIMEDRYDNLTISFLPFAIPPQRFNAIRSIQLYLNLLVYPPLPLSPTHSDQELINRQLQWKTIWSVLASMSGLENLEVEMVVGFEWYTLNKESAKILLAPIKSVVDRGLKNFVLALPFPAMREGMYQRSMFGYGADGHWEGADPWDELGCTIKRLDGNGR